MGWKLGEVRGLALAAVASLALSGCVSWGAFGENLKAYHGRPAQDAFDVLGYPDGQQQFGSDTVYTWGRSSKGALVMPTTSTTTGYVGSTSYSATTTGTQVVAVDYDCTIKMITDAQGIIKKWQYEGNIGGCERYMIAMKKASKK